jgi:hypothetical protein
VEFELEGVPKVIGYVDIIQDNGVPMDIKTSQWGWDEGKAQEQLQPLFYLRALGGHAFDYLIVVKNTLVPSVAITHATYDDVERVNDIVREAWEGMQGWMDPNTSPPRCGRHNCVCKMSSP